jgi:hypothetical protein
MSQQGTAAYQPQIEAAHYATGPTSQWKSSVASMELPGDDDEPFATQWMISRRRHLASYM